jgi:6-phosphogluconolactonase
VNRTEIFSDPQEMAARSSDWITGLIATHRDGPFRMALAGGTTPRALYRELSAQPIDWSRVEFFWIDERFVPHNDPDSNFRLANEALFSRIKIRPEHIHAIPSDGDPDIAARMYETTLKRAYGSDVIHPMRPLFDFVLLGLGADGHICSLLPGSPVLDETRRWVMPVTKGRPEVRITLTYPPVQSSRVTAFLVSGKEKANAVRAVRSGDVSLPGGRLRPDGELVWLLDRSAASLL